MKLQNFLSAAAVTFMLGYLNISSAAPNLELAGYADGSGAIAILHSGESTDPYFAMQALLLAHDNGMDVAAISEKFVEWLLPRQKPRKKFRGLCYNIFTLN